MSGLNSSTRYRISNPKVIHQTIDGEVVIINLDSGDYYSLTESAAQIWAALEADGSARKIISILRAEFPEAAAEIENSIPRFLEDLCAEKLIVPAPELPTVETGGSDERTVDRSGKAHFVPPAMKKFTDMRELLLLDPVHEVDQSGWPQARPDLVSRGPKGL